MLADLGRKAWGKTYLDSHLADYHLELLMHFRPPGMFLAHLLGENPKTEKWHAVQSTSCPWVREAYSVCKDLDSTKKTSLRMFTLSTKQF